MTTQHSATLVEAELRKIHQVARQFYLTKDLDGYMSTFSSKLAYRDMHGRVIGIDVLRRHVKAQFRAMTAADWKYVCESFAMEGPNAIEVLTQTGFIATTAFGIIHRIWSLARRGRYTWTLEGSNWKILSVEIVSEITEPEGFQVGLRAQLPLSDASAA